MLVKLSVSFILLSCIRCIAGLVDEMNVECDRLKFGRDCEGYRHGVDHDERTVYFALMLAFPDPQGRPSLAGGFDDGHDLAPAAYLAVEQVNNRSDLLADYDVQLIRMDGGCEVTQRTVTGASELACSCKPIVGIVGPSCERSSRVISQITGAKELSMVSINYGGSQIFADRPFSFGILGSNSITAQAIVEVIKYSNWTKSALLYAESHSELGEKILRTVPTGYEISFASAIYDNYIPLTEVKESFSRVVIILAAPRLLRRTLCLAYHKQLVFPNYQWMFMEAIDSMFTEIAFNYDGRFFECSQSDVGVGLNGSINFFLNSLVENNGVTITQSGLTPKEYREGYEEQIEKYAKRFGLTSNTFWPSEWARGIYDAVWSMAYALNSSLQDLNMNMTETRTGSNDLAQIIRRHMLTVDIQGVTGRIRFDGKTGFNSDGTINVYQYGQDRMSTKVGQYTKNVFTVLSNTTPVFINATFDQYYEHVDVIVAVVIMLISITALLLTISAQVVIVCCRNHKSIKATSSPGLNLLIFVGCYAILLGIVMNTIAETLEDIDSMIKQFLCNIVPWFLSIGATLIMGTICMRTWRLHRIYANSRKLRRKKMKYMTDKILSGTVITLVTIDIAVCIIWSSVDNYILRRTREIRNFGSNEYPVIVVSETCYSRYTVYWLSLILIPKGVLVVCSFFLALFTRIDKKEFQTKNVIIMAYFLAILFGIGTPLYAITHIMGVNISIRVAAFSLLLDATVYICVFALFLPPIYVMFRERIYMTW